jgi:hypothetical protein
MTVPDDGWHEVPVMVMLSVKMPFGCSSVVEVLDTPPDTETLDARLERKERP